MTNIESDYEEKDVTILRRILRIGRSKRFAIKKIN